MSKSPLTEWLEKVRLSAPAKSALPFQQEQMLSGVLHIASVKPLVIANGSSGTNVAIHSMRATFKGKIDGFKIETNSTGRVETILDLDFALDTPIDKGRDGFGQHGHGTLINAPARGVISRDWDAS